MLPHRNWLLTIMAAWLLLGTSSPASAEEAKQPEGALTCRAFLIYNLDDERVVAVYEPGREQPVASLTKLMTAILACERLRFDGRYRLSASEAKAFGVETMRVDTMLELMLIPSNNAICRIVARLISGSEESFALEMNAKATQLGMYDTMFINATGLPGQGQQSTLGDLLILARVAMTYPHLAGAASKRAVELNGKRYDGTLKELYQRHPGLIAGKTGYTRAAGRCLVLFYESAGTHYLVITLKSDSVNDGFRDAEILLRNYGLYFGEVGEW